MDSCGSHAWQWMYPPLQCHAQGWLDVGDGHAIHWEVSGNPLGPAALFVHGGPGAGCGPDDRRWFDPAHYRIVLFDQRGTGRSRPPGRLQHNTTDHLMRDIEALREHLKIDDWLLFGGSWGATLALAYAQGHPQRVRALVLRGVFLATTEETRWLYGADGAAARYPAAARPFLHATDAERAQHILLAYQQRLRSDDEQAALAAAQAWLAWERDLMRLESGADGANRPSAPPGAQPDASVLAAARIGVHYALADYFIPQRQLLADATSLLAVPGVIVQGTRDLVTPPTAARSLHAAWTNSTLREIPGAGHASRDPAMARELVAATDRFRT